MSPTTRLRTAKLLIFLSSLQLLPAQEKDQDPGSDEKRSTPEILILPVGEPPIRKLRTVKDGEGNDRLENVAPPKQWTPPEKVVISEGVHASTEVFLQENTLSRPTAMGTKFLILVNGVTPLPTRRDTSSFPQGVQSKVQLCVMRATITPEGPDWTKPRGITFNSDWSVFTVGSFRIINMSSYPATFQTAKTKVLIPPDQCSQITEPIPNGTPFAVMINTPNGPQRVRQTALDLPEGTRKTMVIYDKAFDKRQTLADILQFLETP